MDHAELMQKIEQRFNNTDKKIEEAKGVIEEVKKDLTKYAIKTAVLETQMSGVVRFGLIIATSVVGIIATMFLKLT